MKTVYFVRHGEAENNVHEHKSATSVYKGANAVLTEKGKEQTRLIAERAAHLSIQVVISSPFERTKQTSAAIVERTGKPLEYSNLFVERQGPSQLLGSLWLDPDVQSIQRKWEQAFYTDERVEDGETFSEIRERARKAMSFLESRPESEILVVTHGFFLRIFIAEMIFGEQFTPRLLEPMDRGMHTKNTGLTVVKYDPYPRKEPHPKWWLTVWNDHTHLR